MFLRAISAIIALLLVYFTWYFFKVDGLVTICIFGALKSILEYARMIEQENKVARYFFTIITFSFFLVFTFLSQSFFVFLISFMTLSTYFTLFTKYSTEMRGLNLNSWLTGLVYAGALTGTVTLGLRNFQHNFFIALFILSFGTDTFAYLGGRLLGKHKLSPLISPNKTIEGSVAGLIFGSGLGYLYLSQMEYQNSSLILILCCILASLFSQAGDLFESMVKRNSGVKDSGKLMPGHGGVLDRIDGLLFAAPPLYLWMLFFT